MIAPGVPVVLAANRPIDLDERRPNSVVAVVFLFTKPLVTVAAGTRFFGGGHRWSGLDPARLGARAPWRSGSRRTGRPQRPVPPVALGGATPDQPRRRGDQQH
jgi:hypothetical protein